MSNRTTNQILADLRRIANHPFDSDPYDASVECAEAADEVERLRDWKEQAILVISRWDDMWELVGRPGPLGASRPANVRALIERLQEQKELLRTELAKHGWGDFHYDVGTVQDPAIVQLLEETK